MDPLTFVRYRKKTGVLYGPDTRGIYILLPYEKSQPSEKWAEDARGTWTKCD